jgi:uncharacterized protein
VLEFEHGTASLLFGGSMQSRCSCSLRSFYISSLTAVLLAFGAWQSCHAQSSGEIERLRKRAEAGYLAEQMKLAHAFQYGIGVASNPFEAARWTLKAANQGDPRAQTDLGVAYFNGTGVQADPQEAFKWFQRAALTNYPPAENDVAVLLSKGIGVQQDAVAGARWMRKAAETNLTAAQLHLGIFYLLGIGVQRDSKQALAWIRKAAKQHYSPAEFLVGQIYEQGIVVPGDLSRAVHWYKGAADHGCALAENALGSLYEKGNGVAQDKSAAMHWYGLAAEQGNPEAFFNLTRLYLIDGIADRAYFWGSIAMRNSSNSPVVTGIVANLRAQLGASDMTRVDADVAKWLEMHPPRASDEIDLTFDAQRKLGLEEPDAATIAKGRAF